jgi:uncharacterized protein YndB with AHSA1/START domain
MDFAACGRLMRDRQAHERRRQTMTAIDSEVAIRRPADEVWAVLRDLAAVTDWVPGIAAARVGGEGRRICTTADGAEIHEEIELAEAERAYTYSQPVHPLGFRRSQGRLAVVPNGGASRVIWHAEVEFDDDAQESRLLPLLEQGYTTALQTLRERLERGEEENGNG